MPAINNTSKTANALRSATTSVNVSSATAPSSGQVLTATSTTAATWQTPTVSAALPDGWVDVIADYGAVGDGTTDDTTAFQNAAASGKNVYIPCGTLASPKHYLISSSIVPSEGTHWRMDSYTEPWGAEYAKTIACLNTYVPTCLLFTSTSTPCIQVEADHVHLEGLCIFQHPSYTAGAGNALIRIGHATTNAYWTTTERCLLYWGYDNLRVFGNTGFTYWRNNISYLAVRSLYNIDLAAPKGDIHWYDNSGGNCPTGLYIHGCDTSRFHGGTLTHCDTPLWIRANNAVCNTLTFIGFQFESPDTGTHQIIIGGSTYGVDNIQIIGMETFHATTPFTTVVLNSNATECSIIGWLARHGNYTDAGSRNTLTGAKFSHPYVSATGTCVTLTGTRGSITDCTMQTYTNGIHIAAGSNYHRIIGNDLAGVTNPLSTTTDATAKATGRGVGNIGVADW